tara:strand:- start:305 stop:787 length:483 start_codon:yes stop_codon:yes gene_type:complete
MIRINGYEASDLLKFIKYNAKHERERVLMTHTMFHLDDAFGSVDFHIDDLRLKQIIYDLPNGDNHELSETLFSAFHGDVYQVSSLTLRRKRNDLEPDFSGKRTVEDNVEAFDFFTNLPGQFFRQTVEHLKVQEKLKNVFSKGIYNENMEIIHPYTSHKPL